MTENWLKAVDDGKSVVVLFIDFQKAFDSVSHPILMKKLAACGITGSLFEYIESYLKDRNQFTVINGTKSDLDHVRYGVPQDSLLGPNCFSNHVNDMPEKAQSNTDGELDLFADDSTAFEIADSVDNAIEKNDKNY